MNALRAARFALRAKPINSVARRTYADAAGPADKIRLSLTVPHQAIYKASDVIQVNIPAESGDMGILANHVASVEQLRPGIIDIIEEGTGNKQFFLSGGFAVVQPDSQLSINAVEAYAIEDFSPENVRALLAEAQKIANGSGSEQDVAEAKIEVEVLETLQAALK
ncbi:F1 complex, delta/epsilon subunit of ATPase [Geopyxis carbonaria]|nr:F1 complex, delta/epsilon subunit of ATPase [Geopyxis carbonaria]